MQSPKILHYPDKRLRIKAKPVKKNSAKIKSIIYDMFNIMNTAQGIGLAATQINIHLQIIVINSIKNYAQTPLVLINPKLINCAGKIDIEEGCLSIPNYYANVSRSKNITIHARNENWKKKEIKATNLLSVCIQHEMDHLIGKLFIDYLQKNN